MTASEPHLVSFATRGGAAHITLDSPHNRNAISTALVTQLHAASAGSEDDAAGRRPQAHRRHVLRRRRLSEASRAPAVPG